MLIGLETSKIVAATLELQYGSRGSVENTWYPVYASSKKQNMVCLSSGESELMGTGWWSLRGNRNERPMVQNMQLLAWDDCFWHGQFSSRERVVAVATWTRRSTSCRLGRWNLDKRILKVHGVSQQVADCLTKIMTPSSGSLQSPGT